MLFRSLAVTVFFAFLLTLIPFAVQAEDAQADEGGIKTSTDLQFQISTLPEIKIHLSQSLVFPFLQGTGPLTKDNNLTTVFAAEVSPVSLNGMAEIIWTPAAFFLLSGGYLAGSGWNMSLGNGIGINTPQKEKGSFPGMAETPRKAKIEGEAFDGLIWRTWGAATVQFDLGAVIPGDWTHVLFQSRQEFRYAAYTQASGCQSWVFENDDGENMNGWRYYASYVLGYHMPQSPVLDTIAVMAELNKSLYNLEGGDYWGDGLGEWMFSGLMNFSINSRFNTAFAAQFRTRRNHGISDFNNKDYFYRDFELFSREGQRRILFYRAAVILNFKL